MRRSDRRLLLWRLQGRWCLAHNACCIATGRARVAWVLAEHVEHAPERLRADRHRDRRTAVERQDLIENIRELQFVFLM